METSDPNSAQSPSPTGAGDSPVGPIGNLTPTQAGALLAAGAPAFRSGSSSTKSWQPPSVQDLQQALPQYQVQGLIGRGGMGAVYRAMQPSLSRPVAIKILPTEVAADDPGFAERFINEAKAMARLNHPNIVAVYEFGETPDGLLFFVMEHVEGRDVAQMIAAEGRLDPAEAISIASAVCTALTYAHEEGIIHRDVKPSNIMVDKRGRVKVADFGLAKALHANATFYTSAAMAVGTPDFVAPELMAPGATPDARADIYALGITLYQMLTAQIPRGRFQLPSKLVPMLDSRLDRVVDRALQSDPAKRYPSTVDMGQDLDRIANGTSRWIAPIVQPQTVPRTARVMYASIGAALLGSLVWWWFISRDLAEVEAESGAPSAVAETSARGDTGNAAGVAQGAPETSPVGRAEAVWRNRWHKPGRLRAAGTDMQGRPFNLEAAAPYDDFVKVFCLDRGTSDKRVWAALRASGALVWSDGTVETDYIGMVRSWGDVEPISKGAMANYSGSPLPLGPLKDLWVGKLAFLRGRPKAAVYRDLSDNCILVCPALTKAVPTALPDLSDGAKIKKIVVDYAGIGVLREDGSLRVWNTQEVKLPEQLRHGVVDVISMARVWAVLKTDGRVFNVTMGRPAEGIFEVIPEPTAVREFSTNHGPAVALGNGGYSPLLRHADGHWSATPNQTLINRMLAELHRDGNESFSAFHSSGREGILWIESKD